MKIQFTGTWPEIRTEIQKFAIEHLNVKVGVADEAKPVAPANPTPVLTSVNTTTESPKKRGRRSKAEIEAAAKAAAGETIPTPASPTPVPAQAPVEEFVTQAAATGPEPTHPDCVSALEKVYNKFGMEKSLEILSRFGVKRARELDKKHYREFIALCQQTAG